MTVFNFWVDGEIIQTDTEAGEEDIERISAHHRMLADAHDALGQSWMVEVVFPDGEHVRFGTEDDGMVDPIPVGSVENLKVALVERHTAPLFSLGHVVATQAVLKRVLERSELNLAVLLHRHVTGDWGDMGEEDRRSNDEAVRAGARIFSSYGEGDERVWIITEADRSSTTILLPEDY
jgi:hypothetical protein